MTRDVNKVIIKYEGRRNGEDQLNRETNIDPLNFRVHLNSQIYSLTFIFFYLPLEHFLGGHKPTQKTR